MTALRRFSDKLLRPAGRWLALTPGVPAVLFGFGFLDLGLLTQLDLARRWPEAIVAAVGEPGSTVTPAAAMLDGGYALAMRVILGALPCLGPAFLVWAWRRHRRNPQSLLPTAFGSGYAAVATLVPTIRHNLPEAMASVSGDEPYVGAFVAGLVLAASAFALPVLAVWLYRRATTLDRYVARSFLTPFLLCFSAFLSIWLISDMANNGSDYAAVDMSGTDIGLLYLTQLPAIVMLVLPITLLLAVLYSLGQMSRRNELVSMMMAGRTVARILLPMFVAGAMATHLSLACNFQFAPTSVGNVKAALTSLGRGSKQRFAAFDQAYMNRAQNRLWFVGLYPRSFSRKEKMESVAVVQFDPQGKIQQTIHANSAFWQRDEGIWVFFDTQVTDFDPHGDPVKVTTYPRRVNGVVSEDFPTKYIARGWSETPWKLVSSGINPEFLGVPQLGAFLRAYRDTPAAHLAPFRTHWHHRLALPFACLAAVLFGAPLGIVYSRRGLVGSVSVAVGLFFALLFVTNFSIALGQGDRVPGLLAAWFPPLLFCGIGLWLLNLRSHNREILSPGATLTAALRRLRLRLRPGAAATP